MLVVAYNYTFVFWNCPSGHGQNDATTYHVLPIDSQPCISEGFLVPSNVICPRRLLVNATDLALLAADAIHH